jgi:hypothetical protein
MADGNDRQGQQASHLDSTGPWPRARTRADAYRRSLGLATIAQLDTSPSGHLRAWGY